MIHKKVKTMDKEDLDANSFLELNDVHPKNMTKELWIEDFTNFYNTMKENYPYFWVKERTLGYNWLDLKEKYLNKLAEAKDDFEILTVFWNAITALQDAHTSLWLPHWMTYHFSEGSFFQKHELFKEIFTPKMKEICDYWKPILEKSYNERFGLDYEVLILYTKGNYVIIEGRGDWKGKYGLGSKIIEVNGKPIDDAIFDTYEKAFLYWDTKRQKPYQLFIDPKLFGAQSIFTLETIDGQTKKVTFETKTDYNYRQIFNYPSEWMATKLWPGKKIAYISFRNFELGNFNDETCEYLLAFYKQIKDYTHLIIDIRGNSGGWNEVWQKNIVAPLTKKKLSANMFLAYRKGSLGNLHRKTSNIETKIPAEKFNNLPPEVTKEDYTIYDNTITIEPSSTLDFNAKIAMLIDNMTWSAATALALFSKETNFAAIYGTSTKGEGISDGTIFYVLPNSKIFIRFNPSLGIDFTGNSCEEVKVQPDIYYESEIRNQNELVEFVLNEYLK